MKRVWIALVVVLIALAALPACAQDGDDGPKVDLPETYSEGGITLRYPPGWIVQADNDGGVELSNMALEEDAQLFDVLPGQIVVSVANWSLLETSDGLAVKEDDPKFTAGLTTGVVWISIYFSMAFEGLEQGENVTPQMTVGEMEEVELSGDTTYLVPIQATAISSVDVLIMGGQNGLFVNAHSQAGEIQQWRETILAIAETVEFSEVEAVEQSAQVEQPVTTAEPTAEPTTEPTVTPDQSLGTRLNPIPLGEFYQLENGKVRILGIEEINSKGATEGYQVVAFDVEYICEIADPNESCKGGEFNIGTLVSEDGVVLDSSGLMMFGVTDDFNDTEAYGGNTLRGREYVEVPPDAVFSLIRYEDYPNGYIFFSVQ